MIAASNKEFNKEEECCCQPSLVDIIHSNIYMYYILHDIIHRVIIYYITLYQTYSGPKKSFFGSLSRILKYMNVFALYNNILNTYLLAAAQ